MGGIVIRAAKRLREDAADGDGAVRRRFWVRLIGGIMLFALGLFSVVIWGFGLAGERRYEAGEYQEAVGPYASAAGIMPFERWKAQFGQGTALLAGGDPAEAEVALAEALETVPEKHECSVRINLSLAQEIQGDDAVAAGNPETAATFYEQALATLRDGGCPSTDEVASEAEERLLDKLVQASEGTSGEDGDQDEDQESPSPTPTASPSEPSPGSSPSGTPSENGGSPSPSPSESGGGSGSPSPSASPSEGPSVDPETQDKLDELNDLGRRSNRERTENREYERDSSRWYDYNRPVW